MKIVTIILSEYLEEQNIASEAKLAKELGPMIPTGDRNESGETIRIPHSGFVHDNVEYKLVGFGKLDKRKYDIPSQVEKDILKLLGDKGRWFYTEELKLEISKRRILNKTTYDLEITYTTPVLGTQPQKDVAVEYITSKAINPETGELPEVV